MNDFRRDAERNEDLREAWNALSEGAIASSDCPDPEKIWKAVEGELDDAEIGAVIDHLVECPACSEAWRLAREMIRAPAEAASPAAGAARQARSPWRYPLAAAAALALLVGGLRFLPSTPDETSEYRQIADGELRSLVSEESLARSAFVLRWTHAGDGALYGIRVMTENLGKVDAAEGLEEARYQVPPDRLTSLPAGTRLIWQVEALLPDGRRIDSETFFVEIGPSD